MAMVDDFTRPIVPSVDDGASMPCVVDVEKNLEPIPGAGGLVFRPDGSVLLLKRSTGEWCFPKGHVDAGESPLDTAVREVAEEAGVTASCPDPHRTWITRYHNDRGEARNITWFHLTTYQSAAFEAREALFPEGAFLPPDEARARLTFSEDRDTLDAVLTYRHAPGV